MGRLFSPLVFSCVALAAACDRPTGPAPAASAGAPALAPTKAAEAPPAPVEEGPARAVFDAWLAAQNAGDFATYEALYAPRFEGVRRSGSQTARLDRTRWMKERASMFKQKPVVGAKDLSVRATRDGATIDFVQTWAIASYRDEGPKRMVLTVVDGKLKIAREEMLKSNVLASGAMPEDKFAFAIHTPGPHLVLSTAPKEEWGAGAPKTVSLGDPVVVRKDAGTIPPELAAWAGKKVELFGKSGLACEGTIGALAVIGRVVPHFGTTTRWKSTGDHVGESPPPPAAIASEAWGLTASVVTGESGRLLVGEVTPSAGDCKGALWGRVTRADKPTLVEAQPADPATKTLALAELRKTKAYGELQRTYTTEKAPTDPARWEDFESKVNALVFPHPSGQTVVTLSIQSGTGCGSFGGMLSASWERKGASLVPMNGPEGQEFAPESAGDVDGDGKIDLIWPDGLLRSKGEKFASPIKLTIPMLDCGC